MTKKSRIAPAGGSVAVSTPLSRNGMVPLVFEGRQRPSDKWGNVSKEQIGAGYEVAEPSILMTEKKLKAKMEKSDPVWRNKFIEGESDFIFYVVTPKLKKVPPRETKKPLNYKNKLDRKTKRVFESRLAKNIEDTASFIVKELLPITMSLHSAMQKADELVVQLTEDKTPLPVDLFQKKMQLATHLRVTRFLSEKFGLTEEEIKLMLPEFTKPWSQS